MVDKSKDIKIFNEQQIRSHWDPEQEKWYFSVVDVVKALAEQVYYQSSRNYWKILKHRLVKEGN